MLGSSIEQAKLSVVQVALDCPSIDAAWAGAPRYLAPSREAEVSFYVRSTDSVQRDASRGTLGTERFALHLLIEVAKRSTREHEREQIAYVERTKWVATRELDDACSRRRWGPAGISSVALEVEREDTGYTQDEYVGRVYLTMNALSLITPRQ
jgi:hypothetical protein